MAHAQQRQPGNGVAYFLTYKRVKNINLRIGPDGEAHASAPFGVPAAQVDAFVLSKAAWLERAKARAARRRAEDSAPCAVTPAQALALFEAVSAQVFPCFSNRPDCLDCCSCTMPRLKSDTLDFAFSFAEYTA